MNIKTVMRYISFFIVSLVLLTGCGDNNSPQYQHSMDNNIGKIENSKSNRVMSNKISVTSASKIAGLYVAYFKRAPDLKGLNFWKNRATKVDSQKALKELSAGFSKHPTFISTYKDMNSQEFVEAIYHNVLSKAGDAEGIEYWTKYLDGGKSRSDMVAEFVEISLAEEVTAENYPNLTTQQLAIAQERQDYITNKVKVALSFTTLLGTHTNVANDQHPESDPAYLASIKILSDVTADSASVSTVIDFLNGIKGDDEPIDRINSTKIVQKKNYKVILKTTEKIAGYEVHLKFISDTPIQSDVVINNSFLETTGRTVKNLGADINSTDKMIKFGGFTFGKQGDVIGDFDVMTFKSADSLSQITITKKSCVDKDANDITCDVLILDN